MSTEVYSNLRSAYSESESYDQMIKCLVHLNCLRSFSYQVYPQIVFLSISW